MSDRDALLRHIIEHPDDDAPRLVMADWLDEHGEPERAEFIRLQIEAEKLPETDSRRSELFLRANEIASEAGYRWLGSPDRNEEDYWPCLEFERGFVEVVGCPEDYVDRHEAFVRHAAELFAREPILALFFHGLTDGVVRVLVGLPELRRVDHLQLRLGGSDEPLLRHLLASARWDGLRYFSFLTYEEDRLDIVPVLAACPHLALEGLALESEFQASLSTAEVVSLTRMPHLANLRRLAIRWGRGGDLAYVGLIGLRIILAHWTHLTSLDLNGNYIRDDGVAELLAWPHLPALRFLGLGRTSITRVGLMSLVGSPAVAELESLDLRGAFRLTDADLRAILDSPHLARLRSLTAWVSLVLDPELRAVAQARFGEGIRE